MRALQIPHFLDRRRCSLGFASSYLSLRVSGIVPGTSHYVEGDCSSSWPGNNLGFFRRTSLLDGNDLAGFRVLVTTTAVIILSRITYCCLAGGTRSCDLLKRRVHLGRTGTQ